MKLHADTRRTAGIRDAMIYGQFIEHFHRQIYGGVYDPGNPLSREDGLRKDVIQALRDIHVPVLRWPGGCFVSAYHWKNAVGPERIPYYDKAWKVEEPCTFGTDEYIELCRAIDCEPYICTNAGSGDAEEMSDWVEYCNLEKEGPYARLRFENGHPEPFHVKYWSIGNENYTDAEIGAKSAQEWGRLTAESAKMMLRADPTIELSAAALRDIDWNLNLLKNCGKYLKWVSIHEYFDRPSQQHNIPSSYEACMAYTADIGGSVRRVRGLLKAMGLEKSIRIAFDEWNLRPWYHPGAMEVVNLVGDHSFSLKERNNGRLVVWDSSMGAAEKEFFLNERNGNDKNSIYTMADAVFTACFLNMCLRNCDIVGMANFAPTVNTRGCIYTYPEGIVLRPTYHVFFLYTNYLGDQVLDSWIEDNPSAVFTKATGESASTELVDVVVTSFTDADGLALAAVNKDPDNEQLLDLDLAGAKEGADVTVRFICGETKDSYNDVRHDKVQIRDGYAGAYHPGMAVKLPAHSVSIIRIGC